MKKVTNFVYCLDVPGKQQHFSLTNGKLLCCFLGLSFFFSGKINLKAVSKPFLFPRYARNLGAKRDFIHKYCLHIAYL